MYKLKKATSDHYLISIVYYILTGFEMNLCLRNIVSNKFFNLTDVSNSTDLVIVFHTSM